MQKRRSWNAPGPQPKAPKQRSDEKHGKQSLRRATFGYSNERPLRSQSKSARRRKGRQGQQPRPPLAKLQSTRNKRLAQHEKPSGRPRRQLRPPSETLSSQLAEQAGKLGNGKDGEKRIRASAGHLTAGGSSIGGGVGCSRLGMGIGGGGSVIGGGRDGSCGGTGGVPGGGFGCGPWTRIRS